MSLRSSALVVLVAVAATLALAGEAPAPKPAEPAQQELPASYYAELARVNYSYRQFDEAIRLYQQAMTLEKDATRRAGYAGSLAEIYVATKDHAKALPLLREAVKAASSPSVGSRYRVLLAEIAEKSNDLAAAEAAYKEAIASAQHEFERSSAVRKLLQLYTRTNRLEQVLAENEKLAAADPRNVQALELLSIAYTSVKRDRDKALAVLGKLAAARPDDASTLRNLATAYQNANRNKEAVATYEKLLALDEQNKAYYCERISQLHVALGDKKAALEWARKITEGSADNAYAVSRLARLLIRLGQPEQAMAEYERAASLARTDAEREQTLLSCAEAARGAKLPDKAEAILRQIARDSKIAENRTQAKRALFQLYEELGKLDEIDVRTKKPTTKQAPPR